MGPLLGKEIDAQQARDRERLLDDANRMGISLWLVCADTVDEEWDHLEQMIIRAARRFNERGDKFPRSRTGRLLKEPQRRRRSKKP